MIRVRLVMQVHSTIFGVLTLGCALMQVLGLREANNVCWLNDPIRVHEYFSVETNRIAFLSSVHLESGAQRIGDTTIQKMGPSRLHVKRQ